MQDATGTARSYDFFRDMEANEQAQIPPSPQAAQMMKAQMQAQSRDKATAAKMQIEQQKMQQQSQDAGDDRGENSALQILQSLIKERMMHFENRMDRDTLQSSPAGNSSDQLAE